MSFKVFSVKIEGEKRFKVAHSALENAISEGYRRGAFLAGRMMVDWLKKDMRQPKSGREYRVYKKIGGGKRKKSRLHTASDASETPAIITGEFRKSIGFEVRGETRMEFGSGEDGLAGAYAKFLEEGTPGGQMEARKPIKRTVDKFQDETKAKIENNVNMNIRRIGFKVKKL